MFETSNNINIYSELRQLKDSFAALQIYVARLEQMIVASNSKGEQNVDDATGEFITVNEILRKYNICHKTFFNYKKHIPLKKAGKVGRFDRYRKQDVKVFIEKIMCLKNENPGLFPSPFIKTS